MFVGFTSSVSVSSLASLTNSPKTKAASSLTCLWMGSDLIPHRGRAAFVRSCTTLILCSRYDLGMTYWRLLLTYRACNVDPEYAHCDLGGNVPYVCTSQSNASVMLQLVHEYVNVVLFCIVLTIGNTRCLATREMI